MKSIKRIMYLPLIVNLIFILGGSFFIYKKGGIDFITSKIKATADTSVLPYYTDRETQFEVIDTDDSSIVFLGDSLIDNAEWSEIFNSKIVNRGIQTDTTRGVLDRLDTITADKPSKMFLMIGTNDLGNLNSTVDDTLKNYEEIITSIESDSPDTEVYVQSVLPINNELKPSLSYNNKEIVALNDGLNKLSKDYNLMYVDLYSKLEGENGMLDKKYTNDGIHLNGDGYIIWSEQISEYIN